MEKTGDNNWNENIMRILKGSIISIVITLVFLLILSMVLTYTTIGEDAIIPGVIGTTAFSILIGSALTTNRIRKNGIVNGAVIGLVYMIAIYLLSSLTGVGFSINTYSLIMIAGSIIAGMIGGIIGVNLKK